MGQMKQREKLIELLCDFYYSDNVCTNCEHNLETDYVCNKCITEHEVDHLLANSVVVLPCRCGECKHFYKYNCHSDNMRMNMCKLAVGTDGEDFFCSYGERKGGDE